MAQAPSTPTPLPQPPPGTPPALIKLFSLLLLVAGPLLAFWDPSGKLNSGMAQALVVAVFVVVSGAVMIVHLFMEGRHLYGWSLTTLNFVLSSMEKQVDADWLEFKNAWPTVAPLVKMLPGHQGVIENLQQAVSNLQSQVSTSVAPAGLTPEQVVAAVESVTGITLPRSQVVDPPVVAPVVAATDPPTAGMGGVQEPAPPPTA